MANPVIVDRGGFGLATWVDGCPVGAPWIVLSNSLGATAKMWEPQLALLGKRYRILRYDTRGHGASGAPSAPYSFDDLTGDVIALMDHFDIARADYMGLSLGGMTGLGLAIHHGARLGRLICCDARADNPQPFVQSWDERMAAIDKGGLAAIVGATMERWFVESWRKANPEVLRTFEDAFLATSLEGFKGCAEALKRLDYLKDLGGITVPLLYIVGAKDQGAPPAVVHAMSLATPGSAYVEIADAAHLSNIDNTKDFNAAIGDFLGLA
jgi:3-oxoadipate enol-lactonase